MFILASSGQVILAGGVKAEKSSPTVVSTPPGVTIIKRPVQKVATPTPSTSKNVQVRVLNSGASPQRVVQVQRTSTSPRILNQSFGSEMKIESSGRPVVVRKMISSDSEESQPAKKTKFITLTTSQINQIEGATIMGGGKSKKIVMLPSNYREQLEKISSPPSTSSGQKTFKIIQDAKRDPIEISIESSFSKKSKRPCNCTKSQCLKFYCDCFAAGEYCSGCNCKDCLNDLDNEEREKAVRMCLERNPNAFKSKEQSEEQQRLHQRGCNCKRSGCLKNYCECYEAKISCSANCRCLGKSNIIFLQNYV